MARSRFLLQDRLFEPGAGGASVGFLDVTSPCYGEVVIEWDVGVLEEIDESSVIPWASDPSATVVPTEIVIVYSQYGVPQTVLSGDVVYRGVENDSVVQRFLPLGRWAYYSMFLRYTDLDTGGSYYQRVASDAAIPTRDYRSTQQLWQRVPMHYRILDEQLAEPLPEGAICGYAGQPLGPLYKFLSVVGFEMDRIRTLTDAFVVAKDPFLGSPRSLDLTAKLLGIPVQNADLGDQRLRRLLNSIGFLRRSKGTLEALKRYLTSFIGTDLTVFQNGEIRVHSQRINYAPNPKTLGASTGYVWRPALFSEATDPRPFNFASYSTYLDEFEYSDGAWRFIEGHVDNTLNLDDLEGPFDERTLLVGQLWKFDLEIPVRNGDRVVFSTRGEGSESIIWARLVNAVDGTIMGAGRSVTLLDDDDIELVTDDDEVLTDFVPDPVAPLGTVDLANYVEMPVFVDEETTANKDGWITVNVEVLVDLRSEGFSGDLMLVERNYFGSYFDGDDVFCGWFNGDPSVSDCRWEGTPNDSRSLYTEDYERTRQFIELVYRDLIPISTVGAYTVSQFDYVPGTEPSIPELRL
jgi:hypothetical protein